MSVHCLAERTKQWEESWGDKVKQYQVPLFTGTTRAEWALSFDAVIADALELGAWRSAMRGGKTHIRADGLYRKHSASRRSSERADHHCGILYRKQALR